VLRLSSSAPKVLHLLPCSPSVSHPLLDRFDSLLRSAVQRITNTDLFDSMDAGQPSSKGWWSWRKMSVIACTSRLSGFGCKHSVFARRHLFKQCLFSQYHLHKLLSIWSSAFGPLPDNLPSKQPFWDRPGVLADRAMVDAVLTTPLQQAFYLAASSPHNHDWLSALPTASCGLWLDDEAVGVAIGIFLCLPICVPHQCRCGMQVDAYGVHSFVCKRAPGRTARHQALNELIARALASADIQGAKWPGKSRWQEV